MRANKGKTSKKVKKAKCLTDNGIPYRDRLNDLDNGKNGSNRHKLDKTIALSLIDGLHKAIVDIGIKVERDSWRENENSNPPNDYCQWLDINLPDKDGNIYTIHFYFTHDSKILSSVQIFKSEVKKTYTTPNHIAGDY